MLPKLEDPRARSTNVEAKAFLTYVITGLIGVDRRVARASSSVILTKIYQAPS